MRGPSNSDTVGQDLGFGTPGITCPLPSPSREEPMYGNDPGPMFIPPESSTDFPDLTADSVDQWLSESSVGEIVSGLSDDEEDYGRFNVGTLAKMMVGIPPGVAITYKERIEKVDRLLDKVDGLAGQGKLDQARKISQRLVPIWNKLKAKDAKFSKYADEALQDRMLRVEQFAAGSIPDPRPASAGGASIPGTYDAGVEQGLSMDTLSPEGGRPGDDLTWAQGGGGYVTGYTPGDDDGGGDGGDVTYNITNIYEDGDEGGGGGGAWRPGHPHHHPHHPGYNLSDVYRPGGPAGGGRIPHKPSPKGPPKGPSKGQPKGPPKGTAGHRPPPRGSGYTVSPSGGWQAPRKPQVTGSHMMKPSIAHKPAIHKPAVMKSKFRGEGDDDFGTLGLQTGTSTDAISDAISEDFGSLGLQTGTSTDAIGDAVSEDFGTLGLEGHASTDAIGEAVSAEFGATFRHPENHRKIEACEHLIRQIERTRRNPSPQDLERCAPGMVAHYAVLAKHGPQAFVRHLKHRVNRLKERFGAGGAANVHHVRRKISHLQNQQDHARQQGDLVQVKALQGHIDALEGEIPGRGMTTANEDLKTPLSTLHGSIKEMSADTASSKPPAGWTAAEWQLHQLGPLEQAADQHLSASGTPPPPADPTSVAEGPEVGTDAFLDTLLPPDPDPEPPAPTDPLDPDAVASASAQSGLPKASGLTSGGSKADADFDLEGNADAFIHSLPHVLNPSEA